MTALGEVGENKALPVSVQLVLTAHGVKHQPAPPRQRLQYQMHLRIVSERFEMSDPLHPVGNRLLVHYPARIKFNIGVKALFYNAFEHIRLHLAHETHGYLARMLVPLKVKLGVLLLQKPELREHLRRVRSGGENDAVAENGLKHRRRGGKLYAEPLSGICRRQSEHGADLSRAHPLHGLKLIAGVYSQRADLLLIGFSVFIRVFYRRSDLQLTAGAFYKGHAPALTVSCDLIYSRAEFVRITLTRRISLQSLQKLLNALGFKSRTEKAREQPPLGDKTHKLRFIERTAFEVFIHRRLVSQSAALVKFAVRC